MEKVLAGAESGNVQAVQALNSAIKFNGGGHVNHTLFWENLASASREGGSIPESNTQFSQAITETFGGYDNFITDFNTKTVAVQGSGWGWLVLNAQNNLEILDLKDQDTVTENGRTPLLGVDVWEHAYYLDYENLRPKYLENIW